MRKNLLFLSLLFVSICSFGQSFTSIWNTNNVSTGSSADNEIAIPTNPTYTTYNYSVDWGDGNTDIGVTGDITHTYASSGLYTIIISGTFPAIYFNETGDRNKIIEITNWGNIQWQTMENAFYDCENLNFDAIPSPDLSQVTSLKNMFRACDSFNGIVNDWDISNVTDISGLFAENPIFNRPLDNWNTSVVTDMSYLFHQARQFNEPLDSWVTNSVTSLEYTFSETSSFDQDLNNWNVTQVTNMSGTFRFTYSLNRTLNNWIVDNVTDMSRMFRGAAFNHSIAHWNVDNVTNMSYMFSLSQFNQPIENWNVTQVTDMSCMFERHATYNLPLNGWNVENVTNMEGMFSGYSTGAVYNQPLNLWDVSKVTDMSSMFRQNSNFNQDISDWDVDEVTDMAYMFSQASAFDQNINGWNVEKVTNMSYMFHFTDAFNQPLDNWLVNNVTNMTAMFYGASAFDQPLNSWVVDEVTNMTSMFRQTSVFNRPLNNWTTDAVTNMTSMFQSASAFDQDISSWNITAIVNMSNALSNSSLSQANYDALLIAWSAQAVRDNVNLGAIGVNYCDGLAARDVLINDHNWNITGDIVNCSFVLCTNLVSPLDGDDNVPTNANLTWEATNNATGYKVTVRIIRGGVEYVPFDEYDVPGGNVTGLNLEDGGGADLLQPGDEVFVKIVPYNNTDGDAVGCIEESFTVVSSWVNSTDSFKLTFDTNLTTTQTTAANQLKITLNDGYPGYYDYDFSIDWGDDQFDNHVTNDITHTYNTPGIYTISIIGTYPSHYYWYGIEDNNKLISIDQWGTQPWLSMERSFASCENMEYLATDIPDLSNVASMASMFSSCEIFNGNINAWDVSNVTNMAALFSSCYDYDQPLDNWTTSLVTNFSSMFSSCDAFNQPLNMWDTSSAQYMAGMFQSTDTFNQNINSWVTDNVENMAYMFSRALVFDQPLDAWETGNVTDMKEMFRNAQAFDQNINSWDVREVIDMSAMFYSAEKFNSPLDLWTTSSLTLTPEMFRNAVEFNQPISNFNMSQVTSTASMFYNASVFNQNINAWNVTNVTTMASMFYSAIAFNNPLNTWETNSVVNMVSMFSRAFDFNQPLNDWDVSAVANMSSMFNQAEAFDQPLDEWNVSSVTLMPYMFRDAEVFNQDINAWNVASVTDFKYMFSDALAYDGPMDEWDTGEAQNMSFMFNGATVFNQDIDTWDVSFVQTMQSMFQDATVFNQSLNSWNTASVNTMQSMFQDATDFNGNINDWNIRNVTTLQNMFNNATAFNQDLNNWRVSSVVNMDYMLANAITYDQPMDLWNLGNVSMQATFNNATALNQYLGDWDVSGVTNMQEMLDNTALTRENYDNTLIAWSEQTLTSGITLGAEGLPYCDAQEERQSMIDTYGWAFNLDVRDCPIPLCTQITSPLNGDIDVPVNTNLTWEPVLFAQGYRITVGTTTGGNDIEDDTTITNDTSYEFTADFNPGDNIYVTIIPFNDEGDAVGPCTEESFTISTNPATVPECTSLTEPLNGANDVLVTSDLSWNPISNADGYKLTVGTSTGGNDILNAEDVGSMTTYEFTSNLPEDSDIFVSITPYNDEGDAITCTEESFKTELIPVPPVCTNLTTPLNNATDVPIDVSLTWDAVSNATGYLVIVGTTSGGIEIANNIDVGSDTTFDILTDLDEDRFYYVTIIPYNDEGDATGCTEESFRTGNSTSPPSCTSLTAPTNNATAVAVTTNLTWSALSSATGYKLSVGTTTGGTEIFSGDLGDQTTHDLINDLPESTIIYVTITPYNDNGDAISCSEESFTTNGPPLCTTLITPANGAINVPVDTDIEWNASTNADGYKLTVSGSSIVGNSLTDFDVTTGTTYAFANDFNRGETITVTITPYNNVGDATGPCTSETFTIIPPPVPACTTLISPTDNATDVTIDTNLEWNASAGADGYKLTVLASSSTTNNETNLDITTGTAHTFTNNFVPGETVSVTIVPYNTAGDAIGCTTENFTILPLPTCTDLITPANGAVDVVLDTNLEWTPVANAEGYKLTVTGSSSTSNNLTDEIVSTGTTYNFTNNFEQGETVNITIIPFNANGDAIGCTSESFTTKAIPACTSLLTPSNGTENVPIDTDIEWDMVGDADGYKITVAGSISTVNNLTNFDVATATNYNFANEFEQGEIVTITITPYNDAGDAAGCTSESFTIEAIPTCTNLTAPINGAVISTVNDISWNAIPNADGYKLTINGNSANINDVTDFEFTGTTYVFPNEFTQGEVVTVTIIPYNHLGDAVGCTAESFTIRPIPTCTNLIAPINNAAQVSVATDITWNESFDADGYRVSVGTNPNGTDIVDNEDVASLTSYTFAEDLPSETLIYVTILPYNTSGEAVGCTSESFETEVIAPECAILMSPANGETDVPLDSSITWEEVEKADGYRISIGTTPGGVDIMDNLDMSASTSYTHGEEFPFNTEIFVTITSYNSVGDSNGCEQQSLTTIIPEDETKYGFSPDGDGINDFWTIDNIEYHPQNIVTIYNRWGDMVFEINDYDNQSNIFSGMANRKTKMGASELPSGTYFFNIQIDGETLLSKTQGFLVLKR